jgi:hypothetical protein
MATTPYLEMNEPAVQANGLNTAKNVDFSAATSVALPSGTTIGGSSVVALASISGSITTGAALSVTTTGVYTGAGILQLIANSATTGTVASISGTGITSGKHLLITGTAATLTTGRYISVNDTTTGEVFGVGTNGHIISTASASVPTIVVTTQAGITAAAITAGGSDTAGVITTTGTSTGATQLTVTFGKTYTTAPKAVILTPANAAAGMPNTGYIVDLITATTFRITVAAGGTYAATPSFMYLVVA